MSKSCQLTAISAFSRTAGNICGSIAVNHGTEDTLDELQTIVDYGKVLDVSVEHGLYGHITVDLGIINNRPGAV